MRPELQVRPDRLTIGTDPDAGAERTRRVRELICEFAARHAGISAVEDTTAFAADLGLSSVVLIELIERAQELVSVRIESSRLAAIRTVADLLEAVESASAETGAGVRGESLLAFHREAVRRVPQLCGVVEAQRMREVRMNGRWVTDFASANYLALDLDESMASCIRSALDEWGVHPSWTRAVASPQIYEDLERKLAEFVSAPDALVMPTVTLIHLGMIPALLGGSGAIVIDEKAHNSMQEAARLASTRGAEVCTFEHNDVDDLERQLNSVAERSPRLVAVDGVYSMSGTPAPLPDLLEVTRFHGATLYVDDAHGFGVLGEDPSGEDPYGRRGNGVVRYFGLDLVADDIVYVGGLSKAFSSLSAFITCRNEDERMRLSAASTFIFSGPCPTASLATSLRALELSEGPVGAAARRRLHALTRRLIDGIEDLSLQHDNRGDFPLVGVAVGEPERVIRACEILWERGVLITPALFPTAPFDRGLVRFTLTAANTESEIDSALQALEQVRDEVIEREDR